MWHFPEIHALGDVIRYHAARRPGAEALRCHEDARTWAEFDARTNQVANALLAKGLGPQARIAFLGRNSIAYFELMFGVAKAGMVFSPLNWRLAPSELGVICGVLDPDLVFIDEDMAGNWEQAAATSSPPISRPISLGPAYQDFVSTGATHDPEITVCGCDTAIQLYTSGTTGTPKGVELAHEGINHIRLCEHLEPALRWTEDDVYLFVMPNFHLAGLSLVVQGLYNGSRIEILSVFEPAAVLKAISEHHPTIMLMVPAMIQMLLDHPDARAADFSSLRLCMYAGSPIGLNLIKRALTEMNCEFMQFYGATETGGAATLLRPHEHDLGAEEKLKSCGRPLPLIEIRIVDPSGAERPQGEIGEIVIRSPAVFKGYWRNPELTAQVKKLGWYWTGDAGFRGEDGLYYIVDRVKDMIVSGGENIYSAEVEQALHKHPAVKQAAVIGVPDPKWGEAVKACVILREDVTVSPEELVRHCRGLIAGYKVPKSIDFVPELPVSPTGKVLKRELRKRYWAHHDRGVA